MVERGTAKKIFSSSCTQSGEHLKLDCQCHSATGTGSGNGLRLLVPFWEFRIQCTWLRCW